MSNKQLVSIKKKVWKGREVVVVKFKQENGAWKEHTSFDSLVRLPYGKDAYDINQAVEEAEAYVKRLISTGQFERYI